MLEINQNSEKSFCLGLKNRVLPTLYNDDFKKNGNTPLTFPVSIEPGMAIVLDWGRKRTGWIELTGRGRASYDLAGDRRVFDLYDSPIGRSDDFRGDIWPSFCANKSRGEAELRHPARQLHPISSAQRYLRLTNTSRGSVTLDSAALIPSEFPARPVGSFECSDPAITKAWQMGIDTVHLCTQPADQSLSPVFAPFGNGYVQWDGCRRDREIWGGDLRPGALAWYYNFEDQTPIANSLYIIMSAQHVGCDEHGLFPGSGSSHQIIYEWAFWEVTCLWEYILHTGDEKMLRFAQGVVPSFLDWCEKQFGQTDDGWIHSGNSWMYTIKFQAQVLPGLQASAAIALRNMEKLFKRLQMPDHAARAFVLRQHIHKRFHDCFWAPSLKLYKFLTSPENGQGIRSDLCTNCWAILADIVRPNDRAALLEQIKKYHWTKAGSINIAPALNEDSLHNNCIWPYANSYEVAARFYAGDVAAALELLKRYTQLIAGIGHDTLFEMIHIDGSLPIDPQDGNTLSFCHAWAAQASWALQRYLLGAAPTQLGWKEFTFSPLASPLQWLNGKVATAHGTIEIEIDSSRPTPKGKVIYPSAIHCANQAEMGKHFEFIKK